MNYKLFIFYLLLFLDLIPIYTQVSKTVCNGEWNNVETWEGNTLPQAGDSIYIEHYVRYLDTLELDFNYLEVKEQGELCGNQHLNIPEGSRLENSGQLGFGTISLNDTLINRGHIVTTQLTVTNFLTNIEGGSVSVVSEFSCFIRPVCTPVIIKINGDSLHCNIQAESYEWYYNNELITDVSAGTIFPEEYGEYKVRTVDEFGNFSAFSDVYLHEQASIRHFENSTINIYPNPSNGVFHIDSQKEIKYEVKDVLGKTILKSSTNELPYFNLQDAEKGIYFFIATEENLMRKLVLE